MGGLLGLFAVGIEPRTQLRALFFPAPLEPRGVVRLTLRVAPHTIIGCANSLARGRTKPDLDTGLAARAGHGTAGQPRGNGGLRIGLATHDAGDGLSLFLSGFEHGDLDGAGHLRPTPHSPEC